MVSTKDCIHDLIEAWKQYDKESSQNHDHHWPHRFRDAGYYCIEPSPESIKVYWQEMHRWCEKHIGPRHYAWAGSTFWFESDRAAVLFTLRWA